MPDGLGKHSAIQDMADVIDYVVHVIPWMPTVS